MTISTTVNRFQYSGNGVTVNFAYSSRFLSNSDLVVNLVDNTTLVSTPLVLNTDYSVTGAGAANGGTITTNVAPATGKTITIYGNPPLTQLTDWVENDADSAEVKETAFDKLTLICARLNDLISRSFKLSDSDISGSSVTLPTPVASNLIGWNAAANALVNFAGTASVLINSFWNTILGTTTAGAALTLFGFSSFFQTLIGITNQTSLQNAIGISPSQNRLINSNQRRSAINGSSSVTVTAGAALAYVIDCWWAACTGANVTFAQVAGSGSTEWLAQFTGAASVTGIQYGHRVEKDDTQDWSGSTTTLSVEASDSLLTTLTWTAYYANTDNTFGSLASPTKTQIATGTFTITSTLTKYSVAIAIPAAAIHGVEVVFSVGAQTSGTLQIGKVKWAQESVVSPWTPYQGIYGGDDIACQRYHPIWNSAGTSSVLNFGTASSTTNTSLILPYKTPPRIVPTALVTTAANLTITNEATGGNNAATSAAISGLTSLDALSINIGTSGSPTLTAGVSVLVNFNTSAGQIRATGAEL